MLPGSDQWDMRVSDTSIFCIAALQEETFLSSILLCAGGTSWTIQNILHLTITDEASNPKSPKC